MWTQDLDIGFIPLRVLGPIEEEEIRTSKQNRFMQLYQNDLLTPEEFMEIMKKEDVLFYKTEVGEGLRTPLPPARMAEALDDSGPEKSNETEGK